VIGGGAGTDVPAPSGELRRLLEDDDEQDRKDEVDEVHRLDQTHGQEERGASLRLDLGLTSNRGDGLGAGHAVTQSGTESTQAEGETATNERTGYADRIRHVS